MVDNPNYQVNDIQILSPFIILCKDCPSIIFHCLFFLVSLLFQGKWKPRKIANPDYFEDLQPYKMSPIVSEYTD